MRGATILKRYRRDWTCERVLHGSMLVWRFRHACHYVDVMCRVVDMSYTNIPTINVDSIMSNGIARMLIAPEHISPDGPIPVRGI